FQTRISGINSGSMTYGQMNEHSTAPAISEFHVYHQRLH
ncbi:hypothetical protein BLOT_000005, partial [Blomia tropicalis]